MSRKTKRIAGILLCIAVLAVLPMEVCAEKMFSVLATVDSVDVKTSSLKAAYTDPDSGSSKQQDLYWDKSTEFIKEGTPPDFKESAAKPGDIKKGMKLYIRITDSGQKGGKLRLDTVRIKP